MIFAFALLLTIGVCVAAPVNNIRNVFGSYTFTSGFVMVIIYYYIYILKLKLKLI